MHFGDINKVKTGAMNSHDLKLFVLFSGECWCLTELRQMLVQHWLDV